MAATACSPISVTRESDKQMFLLALLFDLRDSVNDGSAVRLF
jgi:hypothetical protein